MCDGVCVCVCENMCVCVTIFISSLVVDCVTVHVCSSKERALLPCSIHFQCVMK